MDTRGCLAKSTQIRCEESGSKQYSTRIAEITFANHRNCSPNSGDCCHQTPNFVGLSALESSLCCMIQIYWFQNQCANRESRPKSLELLKIESFCNIVSASNWRFPNKKKISKNSICKNWRIAFADGSFALLNSLKHTERTIEPKLQVMPDNLPRWKANGTFNGQVPENFTEINSGVELIANSVSLTRSFWQVASDKFSSKTPFIIQNFCQKTLNGELIE